MLLMAPADVMLVGSFRTAYVAGPANSQDAGLAGTPHGPLKMWLVGVGWLVSGDGYSLYRDGCEMEFMVHYSLGVRLDGPVDAVLCDRIQYRRAHWN
jgi:hypothetical protein